MSLDFERYAALTFDCYGTLIDWEEGILAALSELVEGTGIALPDDEWVLARFGELEAEAELGPFRSYREVLSDVAANFALEVGASPDADRAAAFADSVGRWPPFPDSREALARLGTRFRLAIVSNVDDDLFAGSAAQLGADFAEVVTAGQVGSYKPRPAHFEEVLGRLALPRERVLHVAQSLYHDIGPAKALGFDCVWVNRRTGRVGAGATRPAVATPDLEVPTLAALAEIAVPA